MPDRPGKRRGPAVAKPGLSQNSRRRQAAEVASTVTPAGDVVVSMAARRRRRAWAQAVLWLHDHGLPAAVPYDVGGWLRANGVDADWYHRNPCCRSCGEGCWVLAADGEAPPPEIHFCARRAGTS